MNAHRCFEHSVKSDLPGASPRAVAAHPGYQGISQVETLQDSQGAFQQIALQNEVDRLFASGLVY